MNSYDKTTMKSFRLKERFKILRDHFYSHIVLQSALDRIDDKLLLLLDHKLDIRELHAASGALRLKQEVCFQILRIVKRIAGSEGIPFWLDFGTLLGSIRHNGFIPWDDDLDISLLKPDYERLCSVLPGRLPNRLSLLLGKASDGSDIGIARVEEKESGFYIDIYPYVRIPGALQSNGKPTAWQQEYETEFASIFDLGLAGGLTSNLKQRMENWCRNHSYGDGNEEGIAVSMSYFLALPIYRRIFRYKDVFPLSSAVFEGEDYAVPANAKRILSEIYGDFMRFPKDAGHAAHLKGRKTSPQQLRIVVDELNALVRELDRI